MHVPALLALSVCPKTSQPVAVPSRTIKLSAPPLGSPLVLRESAVPTRPVSAVIVSVVGVGVVVVPVRVTVCTPLPSFPSKSQVAVTGPGDVGANPTLSAIEVLAGITFPLPASCVKGFVSAVKP